MKFGLSIGAVVWSLVGVAYAQRGVESQSEVPVWESGMCAGRAKTSRFTDCLRGDAQDLRGLLDNYHHLEVEYIKQKDLKGLKSLIRRYATPDFQCIDANGRARTLPQVMLAFQRSLRQMKSVDTASITMDRVVLHRNRATVFQRDRWSGEVEDARLQRYTFDQIQLSRAYWIKTSSGWKCRLTRDIRLQMWIDGAPYVAPRRPADDARNLRSFLERYNHRYSIALRNRDRTALVQIIRRYSLPVPTIETSTNTTRSVADEIHEIDRALDMYRSIDRYATSVDRVSIQGTTAFVSERIKMTATIVDLLGRSHVIDLAYMIRTTLDRTKFGWTPRLSKTTGDHAEVDGRPYEPQDWLLFQRWPLVFRRLLPWIFVAALLKRFLLSFIMALRF